MLGKLKPELAKSTLAALLSLLSGCTEDGLKRTAYDAIYQRNCIDRYGVPDCESEHKNYDRYKYDREQSLKGDRS